MFLVALGALPPDSINDHIIASPCLVESHKAVSILAEDDNTSDHYGISFVCNIDTVPVTKVKKDNSQSRLKY